MESKFCLWCDDPTGSEDELCSDCRAVHDHPPFYCDKPGHTVPTLGPRCAECAIEEDRKRRRQEANAKHIQQLQESLTQFCKEFHKPWAGAEFGKTIVGNAIIGAIRELGGEPDLTNPLIEDPYDRMLRANRVLESRRK